MLSRTAEHLYWLARYMERAENNARMVMVGLRMANMARSLHDPGRENPGNEWTSTLVATGCEAGYSAKHASVVTASVIDYLVRDPDNPSSILSCLETARRNARAVRTALTTDMWDALNETWNAARGIGPDRFAADRVNGFLDWVKERSQLFNGAYSSTMLRNDAFYFTRLGTFLERADNTARILDVKYHVLLPQHEGVGGPLDYYQWQAVLRSVSATRSYHWIYQDRLQPWRIAELLILRPEMPRSLRACFDQIVQQLELIGATQGGKRGECQRLAGELDAKLRFGTISEIFRTGLHEFLTAFVARTGQLGAEVSNLYLR
jgi:uncharacterized alpha-E superfamily protein